MANELPTGIKLYDSNENVTRQSFNENLEVINDKLVEGESGLEAHLADYAYQTPTIVGTQIRGQRQSSTKRLYFFLNANLSGGSITISLDGGTSSLPLKDVDGNTLTSLEKGFAEVVENSTFFTLRPRGAISQKEYLALLRENANLSAYVDIDERAIPSQGKIYDLFDGSNNHSSGILDQAKTIALQALSAGNTDIVSKVDTSDTTRWFQTGQEITIQDDEHKEWVTVSEGGVVSETLTTDESIPVTVVGSAYTTSASARPVRMNDGTLVIAVLNSTTEIRLYKSIDNGVTWTLLISFPDATITITGISMVARGVYIDLIEAYSFSSQASVLHRRINVNTTEHVYQVLEPSPYQTAIGNCSLTINHDQTELHTAWSSKNVTYPDTFNIRYCKGTINGEGSVTWGSVEQVTALNSSGDNYKNPSIVSTNSWPIVLYEKSGLLNNTIFCSYKNTSWNAGGVYSGGTYAQSSPSADVAPDGSIWVSWHGTDSTDTTAHNLRCAKSVDNGVTWTKADETSGHDKLTSGNTYYNNYSSLTIDSENNVYILFISRDPAISTTIDNIRKIVFNGTSWSSVTNITTNTTSHAQLPSTCNSYRDFTDSLCIYRDSQASAVKFRGVWSETVQAPKLTVSELQHAYKANARVYRSLGKIVDGKMKFSDGFLGPATMDVSAPVTVVASAYTTSASARPQRLSNGWLIFPTYDTSTYTVKIYVSKDNFATTPTLLCYKTLNVSSSGLTLCSKGTNLYIGWTYNGQYFQVYAVNALTIVNTESMVSSTTGVIGAYGQVDSSQTAFSGCSLTINSDQTELHAAWSSKNATHPSYFNIRYCKGTIASDGSVTWGSVTQVTQSSLEYKNPCIIIVSDNPMIFCDYTTGASNNGIIVCRYSVVWSPRYVYNSGTYTQSSPSADVAPNGSIWVSWYGTDSIDTGCYNQRCAKSIDGGVTWTKADGTAGPDKLTSGNSYVQMVSTLTINEDNNVYILWNGISSTISTTYHQTRCIEWNGSEWSNITDLTTNTTNHSYYPSTCNNYRKFTGSLCVYMDYGTAVKFRGIWSDESYIPFTSEDIRYNITPPLGTTNEIVTWVQHDKPVEGDFSFLAQLSIVDTEADENFSDMTNTASVDIEAQTVEDEWQGSGLPEEKVTLKLTMERGSTEVDKGISKLLGVVEL